MTMPTAIHFTLQINMDVVKFVPLRFLCSVPVYVEAANVIFSSGSTKIYILNFIFVIANFPHVLQNDTVFEIQTA